MSDWLSCIIASAGEQEILQHQVRYTLIAKELTKVTFSPINPPFLPLPPSTHVHSHVESICEMMVGAPLPPTRDNSATSVKSQREVPQGEPPTLPCVLKFT